MYTYRMKRVPVCGRLAWYVINCTVLKDLLTAVDNLGNRLGTAYSSRIAG